MTDAPAFHGFRFPAEVILWAVRWYLQFPISYRDLERMLANRGVEVDHTTMYRWVQHFAPELEKRMREGERAGPRPLSANATEPPDTDGALSGAIESLDHHRQAEPGVHGIADEPAEGFGEVDLCDGRLHASSFWLRSTVPTPPAVRPTVRIAASGTLPADRRVSKGHRRSRRQWPSGQTRIGAEVGHAPVTDANPS